MAMPASPTEARGMRQPEGYMTGNGISRRRTLQGLGAATASGLVPAQAQAPAPIAATAMLANAPHVALSNGTISATLYPPGENAFYRGTRFDHAGVIGSLKLNGREFYGPWFENVGTVHDFAWTDGKVTASQASATMGPAEEFDPVGYDTAAP